MFSTTNLSDAVFQNWPIWLVAATLVVAAVIDGWMLKVPNWLTYPMVFSGWIYSWTAFGWTGLGLSVLATIVGLALLMPLYCVGGMGAGDVKLLAGVGAWVGTYGQPDSYWGGLMVMLYAFCATAVIGGGIAILMVWWRRDWTKHHAQFLTILSEFATVRDPNRLAAIAAGRKSSMLLLPYGIPIAIGTILYFAVSGMLI